MSAGGEVGTSGDRGGPPECENVKRGGQWEEVAHEAMLVPTPRQMRPEWPFQFICLFHRSNMTHVTKRARGRNQERTRSTGGFGHYETLVARTDGLNTKYEGEFAPDSEMHTFLANLVNCFLAAQFNDLARIRMETDYNEQGIVVRYSVQLSVGLRVASTSTRVQADTTAILPCIVIEVVQRDDSASSSSQQQQQAEQYRLLCEFGVVIGSFKVDQLVPLTLNNFPQLISLYNELTASELQAPTNPDWTPIDQSRYYAVTVQTAGKSMRAKSGRWQRTTRGAQAWRLAQPT